MTPPVLLHAAVRPCSLRGGSCAPLFCRPLHTSLAPAAYSTRRRSLLGRLLPRRFYAPQLFSTLGTGSRGALLNTVIIGAVNVVATVVAIVSVDRCVDPT